jgi:RES domain-containing protein
VSTSSDLQGRLSSLERTGKKLDLWRAVQEGYDPLSTQGARIRGGRWHPAGIDVLYTSFEPTTARAELARAAALQLRPEAELYPITLARLAVTAEIVELDEDEVLKLLGVQVPFTALVPTKQTQRIGRAAIDAGIEALVVPSVAAPALNAVLLSKSVLGAIEVLKRHRIPSPGRWPKSERP